MKSLLRLMRQQRDTAAMAVVDSYYAVQRHTGPIDAAGALRESIAKVNRPFFESGGGVPEIAVVRRCFVQLQHIQARTDQSSKQVLYAMLHAAGIWEQAAEDQRVDEAQRALLKYNSAMLHSVVLGAISPPKAD